ncbi:Uncharacterized protein Adt_46477 [Abeliophyllum distichum]|uniref:Uncharacterized protein n=1 Tax=Abeliophyllum distichum TaxID=126358 RepID=A0ABD1P1I3_9LAMI
MACSNVETPVFIDTNLGTRIALPIFPDITAKELKRKLEKAHLSCFPEVGKIRVNGLMVKRKSYQYHLSESLPLKYAFRGSRGAWFLQIEAHKRGFSNQIVSFECNGTKICNHVSADDGVTGSVEFNSFMCSDKNRTECKRKKSKIGRSPRLEAAFLKVPPLDGFCKRKNREEKVKRKYMFECPEQGPGQWHLISKRLGQAATRAADNWSSKWDFKAEAEAPSEMLSESISVSGIIKKYFSNYDEVTSRSGLSFTSVRSNHKEKPKARTDCKCLNIQSDVASPVTGQTPPQMPHSPWPDKTDSETSKCKKPEVGKRLLLASNNLGLSPSNQLPALSLCKFSDRKSTVHKSGTTVRSLVFEIPDEGD